ncbi:MAG: hypothetical protein RL748_455 [Pseudomonadota bacterium]
MLNIIENLRNNFDSDEFRIGGGVNDDAIGAAERELGLAFPMSYKEFLKEVGWLEISNVYFFGIPEQLYGEGSVVKMTKFSRENWQLPPNCIVIYSSEDKLLWCIECDGNVNPVIKGYDTEKRKILSKIANDFESLMDEYLDQ